MFNPGKLVARSLLGAVFIGGGLNQLKATAALGSVVDGAKQKYLGDAVTAPGETLVTLNGTGMVAAGAAMALGIAPRTSALALAGMLVPTSVVGHPFWDIEDPEKKMHEAASFMANMGLIGGLMMVAMDPK